MTEYKTFEFDDGIEVTVRKDGDDVETVKPLRERKADLVVDTAPPTNPHGTHGLAAVDMDVYRELAERRDEDISTVLVGTEELRQFAEAIEDEWGRTSVELTVVDGQPIIADERREDRDMSMTLMPRIVEDSDLY